MATAVATRTTVATNIAQAACEKTKNDFANAKELSKKNKVGNGTRNNCESIKNSYENGHGRGHTSK